ncbi:hypothetical protein B0T25DRAFT_627962 [Lasiosphaeria hispida]|uniref:Uncharacterized protein n=1 Tax=Lasiosphaeria hispida TaxID=260671 RepID=A0AAJ0MKU5_9PEZI|nr:hypothetical protein B0T25DRAFT_627962 [Lasiosphaeria hispida]
MSTMPTLTLEVGGGGRGHFLARISLGIPQASRPVSTFEPKRIATAIGTHALVDIFDTHIRGRLIQECAAIDWSHISVVRLGYLGQAPSKCPATIVVAVRPNTLDSDGATRILRSVGKWIYVLPQLHDVAVEVVKAGVAPGADHVTVGIDGKVPGLGCSFEEAFRNVPALGAGLGPQDSTLAGTLGGYLSINTADTVEYLALTCHHVLSAIWNTMERDEKCATLALLRIKQEAGQISNAVRDQLFLKEYNLRQNQKRSLSLARFSNRLGTIYCTGTGTSGGWILDWGLVKLMTGRFSSLTCIDELSPLTRIDEHGAHDKHFLHNEVAGHFPSRCPGTQWGEMTPGEMVTPGEVKRAGNRTVFKRGRTTGSTKGELNMIDSSVRMRYDFDGGRYEVVEGRALLVVSLSWPSSYFFPIAFGHRGDSGSLVFDHQGRVLGMYIGGQTQDYEAMAPSINGFHFISPIHPTLDAIRDAAAKDPALQGQDVKVDFVWGI